jgi:hypothetical protein
LQAAFRETLASSSAFLETLASSLAAASPAQDASEDVARLA